MKVKKFWALALALVMTMALVVPAFASGPKTPTKTDYNVSGETTNVSLDAIVVLPSIKVKIDGVADVIVNPYKMTYSEQEVITESAKTLISEPSLITNYSKTKVSIEVTVAPATEGLDTYIRDVSTEGHTAKELYIYAKLVGLNNAAAISSADWSYTSAGSSCVIMKATSEGEPTEKASLQLLAAEANTPKYGAFKLCGDSSGPEDTTTTEGQWAIDDAIKLNVVFTIKAVNN